MAPTTTLNAKGKKVPPRDPMKYRPGGPSKTIQDSKGDDLKRKAKLRGLLNTSNLPALQNLLKRDPESYKEDFVRQWNHYQSLSRIVRNDIGLDAGHAGQGGAGANGAAGADHLGMVGGPSFAAAAPVRMSKDEQDRFLSLLAFVTQLAPSYPDITHGLSQEIANLLLQHHSNLSPDLRLSCVKSLVLMRNKDHITSEELLRTLLPLLSLTTSATLRGLVQKTILSDLKTANLRTKAVKLNSLVQGWLFSLIQKGIEANKVANAAGPGGGPTTIAAAKGKLAEQHRSKSEALWAVRLAAELWRKTIWRDAKTVQIISEGCFHPHPKVQSSCVRFFLGDLHSAEQGEESDEDAGSDSDEMTAQAPDVAKLKHQRKINKKTRSGDKRIRAAAATARKRNKQRREDKEANEAGMNATAIDLLRDPQDFAEKLFELLRTSDKKLQIELKVRMMQLLSRVMSINRLTVLGFYSYVFKYLAPHQLHVTLILVSVAQSVHEQTPPDVIQPLVRKLSDAFVHPGVGVEVVAAGINTIREMCRRQPLVMEGEADLLEDLVAYRKSKDKGVVAAARSLLALYRDVNPNLLQKRERGKAATMAAIAGEPVGGGAVQFGVDRDQVHGIVGLDLLAKQLQEEEEAADSDEEQDPNAGWEEWELESESSDADSGGWIDVSDDGEALDFSDSDDNGEGEKDGEDGPKLSAKEKAEQYKARRRAARIARGEPVDPNVETEAQKARREAAAKEAEEKAAKAQAEQEALMQLAATKILTPADFAKLDQLRLTAASAGSATLSRKQVDELKTAAAASKKRAQSDGLLDEGDILGPRKKAKADYEERMASVAKGREDREKFGSKKGKRNKSNPSSSTNEQKKKSKNFQMVQKSFTVRGKKQTSLHEKSKKLRKHIEKAKKSTRK